MTPPRHAAPRRHLQRAGAWLGLGALVVAGLVVLSSCSPELAGTVTVYAATSLDEPLREVAADFERANPGTRVEIQSAGSSTLATQIAEGAPADVFLSAGAEPMATVDRAGLASGVAIFSRNRLTLVVPPDNPAGLRTVTDLSSAAGVKVALCQVQVPCGELSRRVLSSAGVSRNPVTQERDVAAVLTKVRLGEVDAGLVYVTDARRVGAQVRDLGLPAAQRRMTTDYLGCVVARPGASAQATAFLNFLTSDSGQRRLVAAGFLPVVQP